MVSVLTALAVLAAVGLLFALDPGGVIAESGFPDFRRWTGSNWWSGASAR